MRPRTKVALAAGVLAIAAWTAAGLARRDELDRSDARRLPLQGEEARLGPLRLGAGPKGSYLPGCPTKVGVGTWPDGKTPLAAPVTLSGARCRDGLPLRFKYDGRASGAAVRRIASRASRDCMGRLPPRRRRRRRSSRLQRYMLFTSGGKWRLEARQGERRVGILVLDLE